MNNNGLGSWPRRRSVRSPERTALKSAYGNLTYRQLAERVDRLAAGLQAGGLEPGTRVAYLGNNHPAFVETLFAANLVGAVFVPLNTRLAPQEVAFALRDSGAATLVFAEDQGGLALSALDALGESGIRGVMVARTPDASSTVPAGVESFESLLAGSGELSGPSDVEVSLEDPALVLYTSGTTGRPKGAVLTHGNLTWNTFNVLADYDYTSDDVSLQISPMFHVASLGMGVLPVLLKGATIVLQERFEPAQVLRAVEEQGVTALSGVPTTFQMLTEDPAWATTDLSTLNKLTCGGSAVPVRVMEAYELRGLAFSGGYGMTETSPGATAIPKERSIEKVGSSGPAHFFTDVRVADPLGQVLPEGEEGEIQIKGPNVTSRYWNRVEETEESFAEGGWFRSGDLGYFDGDGFLYVTGRLKDMIISGGENIYPVEIEQAIMELPEIRSVAVVGVSDERWGEVPRAVVVLKEGASSSLERIQGHLEGRFAKYKVPKHYVEVGDMPRTASGKIRKNELKG